MKHDLSFWFTAIWPQLQEKCCRYSPGLTKNLAYYEPNLWDVQGKLVQIDPQVIWAPKGNFMFVDKELFHQVTNNGEKDTKT